MTIRYIDINRGSDASADPTNPATPWQNLSKLITVSAAAGDAFLLASDSTWEIDIATTLALPSSWAGAKNAPVVIGRYAVSSSAPSSELPTITWRRSLEPADWTYDGANNCWSNDCGVTLGSLAYVRLGTGAVWSAGTATTTALPLASVDGLYRLSGSTLQVYAPAGTDPTTYYGRVHLAPNATGLIRPNSLSKYVRFEDLLYKDGGAAISFYSNNTNVCGVELRRGRMEGGSCCLSTTASTVDTNMDVVIDGLIASDFGTTALWAFSSANGTFRNLEVKNCEFHRGLNGAKQGQVYMQAKMRSCAIHHNLFEGSRYGSYSTPLDGCGLYAEHISDGVVAYANTFTNHTRAVTLNSGRVAIVRDSLFYDCYQAIKVGDASTNNATDYTIDSNTIVAGADVPAAYGSLSAQGSGVDCYFGPSNNSVNLKVRNNIVVNVGAVTATQQAAVMFSGAMPFGNYTLDISDNTMMGYNYMASVLNSGVETASTRSTDANPRLDDAYRLAAGSPVIHTAQHLGYRLDMAGRVRWNPPSPGAFEA